MIHSFSFKNFFSYRDESVVDFRVGNAAPQDDRFVASADGGRLAKVMVAFGANASGKTNLLKVLPFLDWFLNDSWEEGRRAVKIPLHQYKFCRDVTPTTISVETESEGGVMYRYSVVVTEDRVLEESLSAREQGARWRNIFQRYIREGKEEYKLGRVNFTLRDIPKKARRANASFVSAAQQVDIDAFDEFIDSFGVVFNVSIAGRNNTDVKHHQACYLRMYSDKKYKKWLQEILSGFDTGITNFRVKKMDFGKEKVAQPLLGMLSKIRAETLALGVDPDVIELDTVFYACDSEHVVDGEKYYLPMEEESDGSQELMALLHKVFITLEGGAVLVYDELEHGIHPNIIPKIFDLFNSPDMNPRGAQLICTCHLADAMRYLHKTQVLLAEKDKRSVSSVWRLSDVEKVRNDDNFVAKYLSGAYGAIPRI